MWKAFLAALNGVVRFSDDVRHLRTDLNETRGEHRDFARSVEAKFQAHHDAIQRLLFEVERNRENAARDRADAVRDHENLLLRLENERLRAILPPNAGGTLPPAPRPELPPGA